MWFSQAQFVAMSICKGTFLLSICFYAQGLQNIRFHTCSTDIVTCQYIWIKGTWSLYYIPYSVSDRTISSISLTAITRNDMGNYTDYHHSSKTSLSGHKSKNVLLCYRLGAWLSPGCSLLLGRLADLTELGSTGLALLGQYWLSLSATSHVRECLTRGRLWEL